MRAATLAWTGIATTLGLVALLGLRVPHEWLDWQPSLALAEPWRAWSAAWVHYSALHLAANAAGLVLVAALGWAARAPTRVALAWFAAWPLTHFGLLLQPALLHYGGLSGVLHAGVAAVAVHLLWTGSHAQRWLGVAILGGLLLKVLGEAPWGAPLRHGSGWDIAVAPFAHASGLVAGGLCSALAEALHGLRVARSAVERPG